MQHLIDLIIAVLPAAIIIGVWVWFFRGYRKNHQNILEEYLVMMKAQNENLERIAKALEQRTEQK